MKQALVAALLMLLLTACGGGPRPVDAPNVVLRHLNALVDDDREAVLATTCTEYESQALRELDSYTGVETELEAAACYLSDPDATGEELTVNCEGGLIVTYDYDQQRLDLSERTYIVELREGEWLVCGLAP